MAFPGGCHGEDGSGGRWDGVGRRLRSGGAEAAGWGGQDQRGFLQTPQRCQEHLSQGWKQERQMEAWRQRCPCLLENISGSRGEEEERIPQQPLCRKPGDKLLPTLLFSGMIHGSFHLFVSLFPQKKKGSWGNPGTPHVPEHPRSAPAPAAGDAAAELAVLCGVSSKQPQQPGFKIMSLNIFIQATYILHACTMHFMKHIKKADRNYLFLPYSLSLFGGRDNKDLFHFAVCCRMPCNKLRSEVLKNAPFFSFFFLFNAILSWKALANGKHYLQAISPESLLLLSLVCSLK